MSLYHLETGRLRSMTIITKVEFFSNFFRILLCLIHLFYIRIHVYFFICTSEDEKMRLDQKLEQSSVTPIFQMILNGRH